MNLNVIKGRSGSGKTNELLKYIDKDTDNLVITTAPSVYYIEKILAAKNLPVTVISYTSVARFVLKELNVSFGTEIDKETQIIMIGKIINENKDKLRTFSKVSYLNTSLNKIYNFIVECRERGITVDDLRNAYDNSTNILRDKLHDIVIILEIFNKRLAEKSLVTAEDLMALAINSLSECEQFTYKNILIDSIDLYPEYFKSIVKRMIEKVDNLSIAFRNTSPKAYDYHICKESMDTANEIIEYAMNLKYCSINQIEVKRNKDTKNGINIIEQELFNKDTDTVSTSENIVLHEASTMYKEIDFVTSEIKKLLISHTVSPEDIIITSSAIDRYINIIATSLKKHNVDYFYYKNNQLSKSYLYNFVESTLKIIKDGYSVDNILNIAQFSYMGLSHEELSSLDSFFIRFGNNLNIALKNGERYDNANYLLVMNIIDKIRAYVDVLQNAIDTSSNAKEYMVAIMEYLDTLHVKEQMHEEFVNYTKEKNTPDANKVKSIWNGFVKLLNQIYNVFGEERLRFNDFFDIFVKMAEDSLISTTQQYYDQVSIIDMKQAQNRKSKILFVVGCNESYFPEKTPNQIIVDNERLSLNALLNANFKLSKDIETEKQAMIFSTLTMPSQKLFVSWSLNDLDSKPLKYASIITNVVKTFEKNIVKEKDFYDNDREEAFLEFLNEVAYYKNTGNASEDLSVKYLDFNGDKRYSERLHNALQSAIIDRRQINVTKDEIIDSYKEKDFIAVTRMEKFNECPFAHFIEYALKPERLKVFDETAADKGNYFHEVMKKFFDNIMKNSIDVKSLDENNFNDIINPIIEEVGKTHNDSIFESTNKFIFESYKIKERIRVSAWNAIRQLTLGTFEVGKAEYVVGKEIPLDIVLDSGKIVHVIGIIDRLDITETKDKKFVRVIDYKSGNITFSEDLLNAGTQLQLPLYAKAVSGEFEVAGSYYFHISNPIIDADDNNDTIEKRFQLSGPSLSDFDALYANDENLSEPGHSSTVISADITTKGDLSKRSKVLNREALDLLLESSVDIATNTCEAILSGETKAYPFKYKDNDACKYCKYHAICHFDSTIKDSSRHFSKPSTAQEEEA